MQGFIISNGSELYQWRAVALKRWLNLQKKKKVDKSAYLLKFVTPKINVCGAFEVTDRHA